MTENPPVTAEDGAAAESRAAAAGRADAWRLNVLGPVELCYDGVPVEVAGPTRTLLALLARSPCEEISTASIVAGLWGSEPPEDAEKEVASNVSRLRKALTVVAPQVDPTSVVVTLPAGYILAIQPSNADILAFERLAADGRRALSVGQPALALARLESALSLWRGQAYEDFGEHAFARAEANRLEELRLAAIESRVDAQLAIAAPHAPAQLVTELQELLERHWHRERFWGQLMTALFRLGRRSDALAANRRAQETLAEGLRVQPGPELRAVERAVLDSDPSLYGTRPQPAPVPVGLTATVPACVGRAEEAAWLGSALDLAATRRAQARLVIGSAGIGKTRLMAEVAQQAAARGAVVRHWRADATGLDTLVAPADRLMLVVVEDLDRANHEEVGRVVGFIRAAMSRPVVTIVTCRDPVRVGDLQSVPKLVLSALDDTAVAEIVRGYAPNVADATAVSAMVNAGGVPARVHRAASEWAFARAGRRIDRAVADAAEPRRALSTLHDEVVAGALELAHVRARARVLRPVVRSVGCPYPGLAGFGPTDTELFHGREALVAEVLARVVAAPLLALVGEPGTGKSSLIRAGLLPAVTAGVLPDSARWRQILVTPSGVDSLAERLVEPEPEPAAVAEPAVVAAATSTMDDKSADDSSADDEVADFGEVEQRTAPDPVIEPVADAEPARTLLVVDQFEEVFTDLDPVRRAEFLDAVVRATTTGRVVLALRSEFYPQLAEHPALARLLTANTMLAPAMTEDELRRAIERPAAVTGLAVEPGLTDRLIAEVLDTDEGGLTQLAVTLRSLWHRRSGAGLTLAAYQEGAGLVGAVESYAEEVYAGLPSPAARDAARSLLLGLSALVGPGIGVRRRRNLTELIGAAGPAGLSTLEVFADAGLVTVWAEADEIELSHDLVVGEWPRLREWLEEVAAERGLHRQLSLAADAWSSGGRSPSDLYRGARLVTVLDWAERHATELSTVEHDFLAAGNRVVLAADARRRRRAVLLWKWLAATVVVAILAVAVAVVAVTMQLRAATRAEQADAARLAAAAIAEPDLRLSILLAVAATKLDPGTTGTVATVLGRTPELITTAGEGVTAVALSPDGHTLATGVAGGSILLLRADSLAVAGRLDGNTPVNGLAFTQDGRRLVSWAGNRDSPDGESVVVWDLAGRKPAGPAFGQVWPDHGGGLLADRSTLILLQHAHDPATAPSVVAWNIDARTPSTAYDLPTAGVDTVVVAPNGGLVALGSTALGPTVLNPATGEQWRLPTAGRPLAFSPDGSTLVVAAGNAVQLWDLDHRTVRPGAGDGHRGDVVAAAFAADGATLATVGADGAIVLWDARAAHAVRSIPGFARPVRSVVFGADGLTLFTAGDDGALVAWDLQGGRGVAARLPQWSAVALACAVAGRDLSPEEWRRFLPDRSYLHVCPA